MTPFTEGVTLGLTLWVMGKGFGWAWYAFRRFVNSD